MRIQSEVHVARCSAKASSGQAPGADRTGEANLAEAHLLLSTQVVALTAGQLVGGSENRQGDTGCHTGAGSPCLALPAEPVGTRVPSGPGRRPACPSGALPQPACSSGERRREERGARSPEE